MKTKNRQSETRQEEILKKKKMFWESRLLFTVRSFIIISFYKAERCCDHQRRIKRSNYRYEISLSSSLALRLSLNKLVNSRILYNYDCRSMLSAVVRIRIDSSMKWSRCSQKSGFIRQHNTLDNTKANTGSLILYRLVWSSIGRGEGEDIVVIEIIDQFGA